jgi:Rod binding domain-containing protein
MASSVAATGILAAQAGLQQSRMNQILHQSNSAVNANQDAKIDKSAQDFEAMLLSTWLQQAEQSFGTVPGADGDEDGAQRDQMMSLGVQSLSESLAASGGIGIAKMIAKALHATAEKASAPEQTDAPAVKKPGEN